MAHKFVYLDLQFVALVVTHIHTVRVACSDVHIEISDANNDQEQQSLYGVFAKLLKRNW